MIEATERTLIDAAFQHAKEPKQLASTHDTTFFAVPKGYEVQNIRTPGEFPERRRGCFCAQDLLSFAAYINEQKVDQNRLFADQEKGEFRALLDFHACDGNYEDAAWCEWSSTYKPALSQQWKDWIGSAGKSMNQEAWSEWLEDHRSDIIAPSGADIIELVNHLQVTKDVVWTKVRRVATGGMTAEYKEDVTMKSKGADVPESLTLALPLYAHTDPIPVQAQLRYRLKEGSMTFSYVLRETATVQHEAFNALIAQLASTTQLPVFRGTFS